MAEVPDLHGLRSRPRPWIRGWSRRCCRTSPRSSVTRPAATIRSAGRPRAAVDRAREQIGKIIGARDPKEVIFTSGGTESINLALKGVAEMYREKGNHIVTTAIEQRASLDVCKRLERQGFEVTYVPVRPDGLVERRRDPPGAHRQDDPDLGHVRQQRDRHDPGHGRDRQARQGEGHHLPRRRDPGGRARFR